MEENKQQPTQTAVYSEYVGSLKDNSKKETPKEAAMRKKRQRNNDDWKKFSYPNRKMRRAYGIKGAKQYKRTAQEIEEMKTPFAKRMEVMRGNLEHGKMLHQSFQNEVATDQMHYERAKDEASLKSLKEALGSERGIRVHNANRRLRGLYEDKKMER